MTIRPPMYKAFYKDGAVCRPMQCLLELWWDMGLLEGIGLRISKQQLSISSARNEDVRMIGYIFRGSIPSNHTYPQVEVTDDGRFNGEVDVERRHRAVEAITR